VALSNDRPIKQSRLQVQTDSKTLTEVLRWFEQFNQPPLSYDLWWQSQLVLTEGFTNAIRHAHQHLPPTTTIDIEVIVFSYYLEIRIWDRGGPFNLEEKLQSICQEEYDPLEKEGGRGLLWMKQLTDELSYLRLADQRNCLVMRKIIRE
jgi:serine/threonine-protein kinase RsbW